MPGIPTPNCHVPGMPTPNECDERYYSYGDCRTNAERDMGPWTADGGQELPLPLPELPAEEDTPVYVGWGGALPSYHP